VPFGSCGVPERFAAVPVVLFVKVALEASANCPAEFVPITVFESNPVSVTVGAVTLPPRVAMLL
jgi:hypothetical protein